MWEKNKQEQEEIFPSIHVSGNPKRLFPGLPNHCSLPPFTNYMVVGTSFISNKDFLCWSLPCSSVHSVMASLPQCLSISLTRMRTHARTHTRAPVYIYIYIRLFRTQY
jgi:hypothetical protein